MSAAQVRPPTVGRHFARATCAEDLPIPETVLELDLETMTCAAGLAANAVAIRRTGIQVPLGCQHRESKACLVLKLHFCEAGAGLCHVDRIEGHRRW